MDAMQPKVKVTKLGSWAPQGKYDEGLRSSETSSALRGVSVPTERRSPDHAALSFSDIPGIFL
jgi:hypothetical protein